MPKIRLLYYNLKRFSHIIRFMTNDLICNCSSTFLFLAHPNLSPKIFPYPVDFFFNGSASAQYKMQKLFM